MLVKIDSTDKKIIDLLRQDGRQGSEKLASAIGMSPATVRRRVRNLVKGGAIKIVAAVNPKVVGLDLTSLIALDVDHDHMSTIIATLAKHPSVSWISTTTGRFDIIMSARFASTDELASFVQNDIASIGGVKDSETFICLREERLRRFL